MIHKQVVIDTNFKIDIMHGKNCIC